MAFSGYSQRWSLRSEAWHLFEYGKVILPFVVMRRLDCILEKSKQAVLEAATSLPDGLDNETKDMILFGAAGENLKAYNLSKFTFQTLHGQDPKCSGLQSKTVRPAINAFSGQE
jgi:type I restriction-modification system DNA methylase subunit